MKSRKELKEQALRALRGNWPWAIGVFLVPALLLELVSLALFAVLFLVFRAASDVGLNQSNNVVLIFITMAFLMLGLLVFFAAIGLSAGATYAYLELIRGRKWSFKKAGTYAFKNQRFDSIFGVVLMSYIFTLLWSLLLVIPGYIKAIAYSQSLFVLKDDFDQQKGITTTSAITKSRLMMEGHKKDYFFFLLSFIGWYFLSLLTGGLGFFFLLPYLLTSLAAFYEDLRQQEQPQAIASLEEKLAKEKADFEQASEDYKAKLLERKQDKQKAHDEKMGKKLQAQKEREEKRREKVAQKRKEREERLAKNPKKKAKKAKKSAQASSAKSEKAKTAEKKVADKEVTKSEAKSTASQEEKQETKSSASAPKKSAPKGASSMKKGKKGSKKKAKKRK